MPPDSSGSEESDWSRRWPEVTPRHRLDVVPTPSAIRGWSTDGPRATPASLKGPLARSTGLPKRASGYRRRPPTPSAEVLHPRGCGDLGRYQLYVFEQGPVRAS